METTMLTLRLRTCSAFALAGMLATLATVSVASAQTPAMSQEPLVTTTGEGTAQAAPDRAWITISAESRAPSPREAQRLNAELMRPVQEALRGARVPADAIRTSGYDLQQEFDFANNKRTSRGYVARNSIEVRVDEVGRVGELLELAVGRGATNVSGLRFDVRDQNKLEREALRVAVTNARLKAEAAAAGAGRTVDRLVRIEESSAQGGPQPMPQFRAMAAQGGMAVEPPVSIGQIEVRSQVTVTFSLK
jgi:uncharacterized protein